MGGRQSTTNYYSDSDSDDENEGRERGAISADESSVSDDGGFGPRLGNDIGVARRGTREEGSMIQQEPEEKGLLPSERPDEPQRGSPNISGGAYRELPPRTLEPTRMRPASSCKETDSSDQSKLGRRKGNPNALSPNSISPKNKPTSRGQPSIGKNDRSGRLHARPGNAVRLTGKSAGRLVSDSGSGSLNLLAESSEQGRDRGDGGVQGGRSEHASMQCEGQNGSAMLEASARDGVGSEEAHETVRGKALTAKGASDPASLQLLMHSKATSAGRQNHEDQPTLPCCRSEPTTQTSDVDQLEAGPKTLAAVRKSVSSRVYNASRSLDAPPQEKGLQRHPHKSPRFPMSVSGAVNAEVIEFAAASSEEGEEGLEGEQEGEGDAEALESMRDGRAGLKPKGREEGQGGQEQGSAWATGKSSDPVPRDDASKMTPSPGAAAGGEGRHGMPAPQPWSGGDQPPPCARGPGMLPVGLAALQGLPSHPFLHTAADEPPDLRTEFYIIR